MPVSACSPDGLKGRDAHGFTGEWAADEMPAGYNGAQYAAVRGAAHSQVYVNRFNG